MIYASLDISGLYGLHGAWHYDVVFILTFINNKVTCMAPLKKLKLIVRMNRVEVSDPEPVYGIESKN